MKTRIALANIVASLVATSILHSQTPTLLNSEGSGVNPPVFRKAAGILQDSTQINAQSYCIKRMSEWVFSGPTPAARPLLVAVCGDSYATGLRLPPNCAVNGSWNLGLSSVSGGATYSKLGYSYWINGMVFSFPAGSQADLTNGGQTGNDGNCAGNRAAIAYIKEPGAGTFDLQLYNSVSATWTTLATINCANASTIGAFNVYELSELNYPHFRLRVANVTGGTVKLLFAGIWNAQAGGAMLWPHGSLTGQSPTELNSTPSEVFDPIWTALKPDLVLACWQDPASEFAVGGAWRSFYSKAQALYSSDWMLVSANPCNATSGGIAYPSYESPDFQATIREQIDWAQTNGETWVDAYSVFGSYAEAVAKGNMLVSDVAHLTTQGINVRNCDIWRRVPFGSLPLGGAASFGLGTWGTAPADNELLQKTYRGTYSNGPFVIRSTGSWGLILDDKNNLYSFAKSWGVDNRDGKLGFYLADPNTPAFELNGGYVNCKYGMMHRIRTVTANTACTYLDYTVLANATSGNITLDVSSWPATYPGLIHTFKKIDSSANTVTVDPSSTPTIDGAANIVLSSQWQYVTIQSDGTNWVKIAGN